jgi:hypothetical protein
MERYLFNFSISILLGLGSVVLFQPTSYALQVGQKVKNLQVKDAKNNPVIIPDFGSKVMALFYTDPDVKEQNEPFRELLKAAKLDKSKYRPLGVVNLKDTWKPNFLVRKAVQSKMAKFKSVILTDPDHLLKKAWNLPDCNEKDGVIILDTKGVVRYLKMGKMSDGENQQALQLVKELIGQPRQ